MLHNPRYAGAYAYGLRRRKKSPDGQFSYHKATREEWITFIPDAHVGYISLEQFEEIKRHCRQLLKRTDSIEKESTPRRTTLLQGLVICGKCGDRMDG